MASFKETFVQKTIRHKSRGRQSLFRSNKRCYFTTSTLFVWFIYIVSVRQRSAASKRFSMAQKAGPK
jgi:hypothetical protein